MEITFIWSWFSFWVGILSSVFGTFFVLVGFGFKQFKKGQASKKRAEDMFGGAVKDFLK